MGNTQKLGKLVNGLTVLDSGNVGINTSSPDALLRIDSNVASATNNMLYLYNSDYTATTRTFIRVRNNITVGSTYSSYFGQGVDHKTYIIANDTSRNDIVINGDNGNVGIGTNSPEAALHITGAIAAAPAADGVLLGVQSNFAVIHLNGSASTGSLIDFSTNGTDRKGRIEYSNVTNDMIFSTNASQKLTITSAGNVGIGTSSPAFPLHIYSPPGTFNALVQMQGTTNYSGFYAKNTGGELYLAIDNSTGTGFGNGGYSRVIYSNGSYPLDFYTNDLIRMRITNGGIVTIPNQPAFSVYQIGLNGGTGIMTYTNAILNRGGCVNLSNGRFTAPVAGAYQFSFMAFQQTGDTNVLSCTLFKNGTTTLIRTYQNDPNTGYGPEATISAVLSLAANDYVYINVTSGTIHGNEDGFFSGFLIG